ncbi:MAG: 50S ribosomal protein L25 [Acidobacteriota bacterium]|nr:50S ribosomal protein L25 [Acidobacteriota bacterium]
MAGELTIDVQPREVQGKNSNRRMRTTGRVPAVVYGLELAPVPIQVDRKSVVNLLKAGTGENTVFMLRLEGSDESRHTMIQELQVDPIERKILHIDFQRIDLSEKVRVKVPIEIVGVPAGVRNEEGLLDFILRELEVECLPTEIPESLALDVDALDIGDTADAGSVPLPPGVELLDDAHRVILSVSLPRTVEEEEEDEQDELLLEGESDEPEVIGKGKDEEAGEDED